MEEKIEYAKYKVEDLKWKVEYHTKELITHKMEKEMWEEKLENMLKE